MYKYDAYSLNSNTDMKIRGKTQGEGGYTRRTEEGLEVQQLGKSTQGYLNLKMKMRGLLRVHTF